VAFLNFDLELGELQNSWEGGFAVALETGACFGVSDPLKLAVDQNCSVLVEADLALVASCLETHLVVGLLLWEAWSGY